jgi:wyosine [tRNA(Phe)-imidazoG37] synthetase (radical SAM superfamily)
VGVWADKEDAAALSRGAGLPYNDEMSNDSPNVPLPVVLDPAARRAFTMHDRLWQDNRYVYPVVSRRSKGISIGVNLNPDKVCNFDCIYCSVDRREPLPAGTIRDVDLGILRAELAAMLDAVRSGAIYAFDPFDRIPASLRRVNDIAFSGDGEPTTCPQFDEAVRLAAALAETGGRNTDAGSVAAIKLVLITNATMFHRPAVRETLAFLDAHNGEIWAKLDAGTEAYYDLVDRSPVPFARVLENVAWCCRTRPTVIQTLLMKVHGEAPPAAEAEAYAGRLREIVASGGRIKLVQLYTVARGTTEAYATALAEADLEAIAGVVRERVGVDVEVYP